MHTNHVLSLVSNQYIFFSFVTNISQFSLAVHSHRCPNVHIHTHQQPLSLSLIIGRLIDPKYPNTKPQ